MVIFSYGIPKSGSTLAFQLASGVAALGGHWQPGMDPALRVPGRNVVPAWELTAKRGEKPRLGFADWLLVRAFQWAARRAKAAPGLGPDLFEPDRGVVFAASLRVDHLERLVEAAGDRILLVKTHALPSPAWIAAYRDLAARGLVHAHVNHRDPREICLALMDAAQLHRSLGLVDFSELEDMEQAVTRVGQQLQDLAAWCGLPGALHLHYDECAFRTDAAIDRIKADLGLRARNALVRQYAMRLARTERNKAVAGRHRKELDPRQMARMTAAFLPYLRATGYLTGRVEIKPELVAALRTPSQPGLSAQPPPSGSPQAAHKHLAMRRFKGRLPGA